MFYPYAIFVFITICIDFSWSSGGLFLIEVSVAKENGYETRFCKWNGIRFLPNSDFKDYDSCVHCQCNKKYLACNSLLESVYLSNAIEQHAECEPVQIACHIVWVLKADKSTLCPMQKIPEHQAIV